MHDVIDLPIERVNALSPYKFYINNNGSLGFETQYGSVYEVGFVEDYTFMDENAFLFFILESQGKHSVKDPLVRETIGVILETFFLENNPVVNKDYNALILTTIPVEPTIIRNMLDKNKEQLENLQLFFVNMNKDTLYIPAERIMLSVLPKLLPALTLAQASVPRNLLHFFVECNNAKESFKSYDIPLLGITFLHKGEDDYVVVDDSQTIPLDASSSGMQSAIPLLLTMDYAINKGRYRSYVIEEPECNLYPGNQIELIDRIIGIINQQKKSYRPSLTITTHSPYIINYLIVLIQRYVRQVDKTGVDVEELAVYYVTGEGNVTNLISIDNNTNEKIVNTIDLSETMSDIYSEFKSLR